MKTMSKNGEIFFVFGCSKLDFKRLLSLVCIVFLVIITYPKDFGVNISVGKN